MDNVVNNKLKAMSESWPFMKPVNKKLVKDYYEIIKKPMDLEAVAKKVKCKQSSLLQVSVFHELSFPGHKYHSCQEFLTDIELIYNNCVLYNGVDSPFTLKAECLLTTSKSLLGEVKISVYNSIYFLKYSSNWRKRKIYLSLVFYFCFKIAILFQYGDHLTYLEGRIKLAQERALEQADIDSLASYGDNDDNFTIVDEDRVGLMK